MSEAWRLLGWQALPAALLLLWFVLLIGGISAGGLVHVVLVAAIGLFAYQRVTGSGA